MINAAANLTLTEINRAETVRLARLKNVLQGRKLSAARLSKSYWGFSKQVPEKKKPMQGLAF